MQNQSIPPATRSTKFSRVSFSQWHNTEPSTASFTCNRSSNINERFIRDLANLHQSIKSITLKILGFKQTIFLVDTGLNIFLIHEMFIENKYFQNRVSGVTTHSLKTKYGVIVEIGKKYIFHILTIIRQLNIKA